MVWRSTSETSPVAVSPNEERLHWTNCEQWTVLAQRKDGTYARKTCPSGRTSNTPRCLASETIWNNTQLCSACIANLIATTVVGWWGAQRSEKETMQSDFFAETRPFEFHHSCRYLEHYLEDHLTCGIYLDMPICRESILISQCELGCVWINKHPMP